MVPPEPDERDNSNLRMKFKFPNGMQMCRRFSPSSTVKVCNHYYRYSMLRISLTSRNCLVLLEAMRVY